MLELKFAVIIEVLEFELLAFDWFKFEEKLFN